MKRTFLLLAAACLLLCGCSKSHTATLAEDGGSVEVSEAGIGVTIPDGWSVYVGDDVYEQAFLNGSEDYSDADEMKSVMETGGEYYIAYAVSGDGTAMAVVSAQDLSIGSDGEELEETVAAADYARSVHNTTIFGYRASGYMTEGSFSEETMGGKSGWLSEFIVTDPEDDDFRLGQSEFMFEQDGTVFSIQLVFSAEESERQAQMVTIYEL